jgi:hypothetical protein
LIHRRLAALAAGVGGSAAAIELAKRTAAEEQPAAPTGRFVRRERTAEPEPVAQNPA